MTVEAPGSASREIHSFDLPFLIVGRHPEADLRLDHPEVSERHAYVQLVQGRLVFNDLGSRLGIQQAGKRRKIGLLQREPATRIGPYRLRFLNEDGLPSSDSASKGFDSEETELSELAAGFMGKTFETGASTSSAEGLVLSLSHRTSRRSCVEVHGAITLIGSGADCGVRLIDPSVSSHHGSLVQTPEGTWLVDLLGKGGIKLNGRAVNHARLFEGDEAQIGASAFRVDALPTTLREASRLGFARSTRKVRLNPQAPTPTPTPSPAAAVSSIVIAPQPEPLTAPQPQPGPVQAPRPMTVPFVAPVEERPPVNEEVFVAPRPSSSDTAFIAASEPREEVKPATTALDLPPVFGGFPEETVAELREAVAGVGTGLSVAQTAEIVERVVSPLIEQLTEMRRQMLDEFHQARVMMFETIGSLRDEQTAAFNKEIDQLRQLAEELETHREVLAQSAETQAMKADLADRQPMPIVEEPVAKSLHFRINGAERERELKPAPAPAPVPVSIPEPELESASEPEVMIIGASRVVKPSAANNRPPRRPHDEQIHAALCDRITRIKDEHQTRWQKLLGIFPSAANGKA